MKVGDKEYTLRELGPGDWADAQQRLKDINTTQFLENVRNIKSVNLSDEVLARTLADLQARTVTDSDVAKSHDGICFLMWCAIVAPKPKLEEVRKWPNSVARQFVGIIARLSNLPLTVEDSKENSPLECPTLTGSPA